MGAAIFNLVIGIGLVALGLSGFTLIFTDSSTLLIAAGAVIAGLGVFQLIKRLR